MAARVYASATDLEAWLAGLIDMPESPDPLLVRASRRVDLALLGAWYPVDDDGMPTDTTCIAALRDAVCAQVSWWIETGDLSGSGAGAAWTDVSIGKVRLARTVRNSSASASSTSGTGRVADEVIDILTAAGLLPIRAGWWG